MDVDQHFKPSPKKARVKKEQEKQVDEEQEVRVDLEQQEKLAPGEQIVDQLDALQVVLPSKLPFYPLLFGPQPYRSSYRLDLSPMYYLML